MRWARHVEHVQTEQKSSQYFSKKRQLGIRWHRWQDNITMCPNETGLGAGERLSASVSAQDRWQADCCEIPGSIKCWEILD
jgi:hypothetical protein